jgi:hypothetical protein
MRRLCWETAYTWSIAAAISTLLRVIINPAWESGANYADTLPVDVAAAFLQLRTEAASAGKLPRPW